MSDIYSISLNPSTSKQVGYSPTIDELFIYWIEDDVFYALGALGKYQVCWLEESELIYFIHLGPLEPMSNFEVKSEI